MVGQQSPQPAPHQQSHLRMLERCRGPPLQQGEAVLQTLWVARGGAWILAHLRTRPAEGPAPTALRAARLAVLAARAAFLACPCAPAICWTACSSPISCSRSLLAAMRAFLSISREESWLAMVVMRGGGGDGATTATTQQVYSRWECRGAGSGNKM